MTRHFHRRTFSALKQQMFGYGVGLTAFYAGLLRWNWRLIIPLFGLLPRAIGDMLGKGNSAVTTNLPDDFPRDLLRLKKRGMLLGPVAYLRARLAGKGCSNNGETESTRTDASRTLSAQDERSVGPAVGSASQPYVAPRRRAVNGRRR
jgi:hypothetical protein